MRLPNFHFCLMLGVFFFFAIPAHAQIGETRRVVVLSEMGVSSPAVAAIVRDLGVALLADSTYRIEVYSEYLETSLFSDKASQADIRGSFIRKYQLRKPDVIIAVGPTPTEFMVDVHDTSFPGIPIVFCCSTEQQADYPKLDAHFTGIWLGFDTDRTLEAAIHLLPRTKHVVVVGGVSQFDRHFEDLVEKTERKHEALQFTYLTKLPMDTVFERVKHLSDNTIILFTSVSIDGAGRIYNANPELVRMLAVGANAPIFTLSDTLVGQGAVGGYVVRYLNQGKSIAAVTLRILHGTRPQEIAISRQAGTYMFDWRALRRWGIKESNLPPGSIVLNREPTFWELYWRYAIAGIFLLSLQALIIAGLVWQRARRQRAEAIVRESEERFRLLANTAPVMIWVSDVHGLCTYVNQAALEFTGRSVQAELGNGWMELLHPEDVSRINAVMKVIERREPFQNEHRLRRYDGEYRWMLVSGASRFAADGSFAGYIGTGIDITERKLAEEALSTVSQKLIEAQEEERARVARELHDDIDQRLALLAVNLEGMKQNSRASATELRREIGEASKEVGDLASDVQALSHQLHSSKLEYLGLPAASTAFCRELSERQRVEIDFHSENFPTDLPKEISLCLFRVLQEALQNAIKHSGSSNFQVLLRGGPTEIDLTVRDSGVGFDPGEAMKGPGLGLTSIRERLKLVNGYLSIDSQPQRGSTIQARIPLTRPTKTTKAAAGSMAATGL
jgi:PAS domain S-box-containing protein